MGWAAIVAVSLAGAPQARAGHSGFDFGTFRDGMLRAFSVMLFGINSPLGASSAQSIDAATANADPRKLVTTAHGLRVRVASAAANLGANIDMMAPWPDAARPTHLIVCNEGGTTDPGLQRIRLSDGAVETIVTGISECDPVHATPWGTIVFAQEAGTAGRLFELRDPLGTTGVLIDNQTGTATDGPGGHGAGNVVARPALGRLSYEGISIYPSGVVYYGDENRPLNGVPGGAYFKFVPAHPFAGGAPITDLSLSPLADGSVYGLRLGKRSGNTDYGQASETGLGTWVAVTPSFDADLRAAAATLRLTGYYRPEDFAIDPAAQEAGNVRFCANNTGNEAQNRNFGNTICVTDGSLAQALANTAVPEVQLLVAGTPEFAMMDNIAYQPRRGNWLIQEDGDGPAANRNNDVFSCLDDGDDTDLLSDGCVRVITLNDLTAESTGGVFDASGSRYWLSVQHNITGHGVVLEITGWR
jgi:hypothetical protein